MSGRYPKFKSGPVTYQVAEPIDGGQLVEARSSSVVGVAAANSVKCLGVAVTPASNADPQSGQPTGLVVMAYLDANTAVARGVHEKVTYAAQANFGDKLKAAANGQVTPWVDGTDSASRIVGQCAEPGGVLANAVGLAWINP